MKIIEIGAGTGVYSHYFAQHGYDVDAVEIMEHNIEVFKKNTQPNETVTVTQGDAIDLKGFPDGAYDITLLLGPMYHLYTKEDKLSALREAIRVTKKGGVVFAAYCNNDMTAYGFLFGKEGIKDDSLHDLIDFQTFKLSSTPKEVFALYRKEDVDGLMSNFSVTRLHYVGSDMLTRFIKDAVDEMDDKTFEIYLKYHFSICERPDMAGATNHMLDIFRKD
jgi:SAM-dependent methyltransferase